MFEFSKNSFGRTNFTKHSHHTREFTVGGSRVISIHTHHLQSKCFKSTRHISSRSPNTKLRLLIQQSFAHRCCVKMHKTDQLFVDRTRTHALTCAHTNHKQTEHKQTNKPQTPLTTNTQRAHLSEPTPPHTVTDPLTHSLTHSVPASHSLAPLLWFLVWFFEARARVVSCPALSLSCPAVSCPVAVLSPSPRTNTHCSVWACAAVRHSFHSFLSWSPHFASLPRERRTAHATLRPCHAEARTRHTDALNQPRSQKGWRESEAAVC